MIILFINTRWAFSGKREGGGLCLIQYKLQKCACVFACVCKGNLIIAQTMEGLVVHCEG